MIRAANMLYLALKFCRNSFKQGCGSGSDISLSSGSGSGSALNNRIRIQEGKNDPKKEKKVKKFYVLNCWMFSFEG
jgi:hypothetical protein